ncbi:rRNA methyltransferase 3, mitochondrial [Parasteatoda tepidariorum]|uniref:rRNA methyltransferase 3, mitochondrial n=1 Tax=Parasteatoda tepidariorum TaxID=114398 RepID=UPI0039BC75A7
MGFRYLRKLISFTKIEYSYRFYSRNVSRRKTFRISNSSEDSVTSLQQNNLLKLQVGNQNNDNLKSVFHHCETNSNVSQYETLEAKNSRLMKTLALIRSRKLRERKEKMVLEGKVLISDAINAGMKLNALYFCQDTVLEEINCEKMKKVEFFKIAPRTMQLLSESSPEVIGVFQRPSVDDIKLLSEHVIPVTILCDNIRDPGNLGSIIRHAASAGCRNVLLIKGCADPWETKVLKVGCGGHFRIPITNNIQWENLPNYFSKESKIFIADNSSDIEHWEESPELINYDASPKEHSDGMAKQYLAMNEHSELIQTDKSSELEAFEEINLPCYLYSSVMFPRENIVLYVGGETHGVDIRIVKLACDYGGKKVKIPLENSMDSLNSSFAMAIILYEIKRQLSEKL